MHNASSQRKLLSEWGEEVSKLPIKDRVPHIIMKTISNLRLAQRACLWNPMAPPPGSVPVTHVLWKWTLAHPIQLW